MKFLTFLKKLEAFFLKLISKPKPEISILIPFSTDNKERKRNFKWLVKHLKSELPEAEIVIGKSHSKIFCKGEALNNAVEKSKGRILVLLDADGLISPRVIRHCAKRILEELEYGNRLWYVPYRRLYRLTEHVTRKIVESDPKYSIVLPDPLPSEWIENQGDASKYGHHYGAMCMIFPREAYEAIGCFDERFEGWGGEDISFLKTFDVLWGKFKTTDNPIYHLHHPFMGSNYKDKKWDGQDKGSANSNLAIRYHYATENYNKIKILNQEAIEHRNKKFFGE